MFLQAILLGLIQGITEFLPISSSGHLILLPRLFNFPDQGLAVDASLHLATALAIIIYFRQEWWLMIKKWRNHQALKKIVAASIPAGLAGLILGGVVENVLRSHWVVVVMLILIAGLMWWIEKNYTVVKKVSDQPNGQKLDVDWLDAILIGLTQVLALIPGTSRSGITITAGMWRSLPREKAARFSFLLGAPITLGAGLLKLKDLVFVDQTDWVFVSVAGLVTFVSALFAIHWLLKFLQKSTLTVFVWYRVILAILMIVFLSYN